MLEVFLLPLPLESGAACFRLFMSHAACRFATPHTRAAADAAFTIATMRRRFYAAPYFDYADASLDFSPPRLMRRVLFSLRDDDILFLRHIVYFIYDAANIYVCHMGSGVQYA